MNKVIKPKESQQKDLSRESLRVSTLHSEEVGLAKVLKMPGEKTVSMKDASDSYLGFLGDGFSLYGSTLPQYRTHHAVPLREYSEEMKMDFEECIKKAKKVLSYMLYQIPHHYNLDKTEIKQCILISAYKNHWRFREQYSCSYSTWFRGQCEYVIKSYMKHEFNRRKKHAFVENIYDLDRSDDEGMDEQRFTKQHVETLHHAINQAPPLLRDFILLRLKGKGTAEIAEKLGISNCRCIGLFSQFKAWLLDRKSMFFSDLPIQGSVGPSFRRRTKSKKGETLRGIQSRIASKKVLPDDVVANIKADINSNQKLKDIGEKYNLRPDIISRIKRGLIYVGVGPSLKGGYNSDGSTQEQTRLSKRQVEEIIKLIPVMMQKDIAKKFGVAAPAISYIAKKNNLACGKGKYTRSKNIKTAAL